MKHRTDIDGLRALAVLPVVIYHAFPGHLPGGFIGVDVFFVISGFLITSLIREDLRAERFRLLDFYVRRAKRIFPALLVVLAACFVVGWLWFLPDEFEQLASQEAGGATFSSNFLFWQQSGYFDANSATKPLLHLWSLAIEEQFYLLWPLLLMIAWRRTWSIPWLTAAILLASFVCCIQLSYRDTAAAYYSPAARFWELMAGGLLAHFDSVRPQWRNRFGDALSIAGLLLYACGLAMINNSRAFPGWWALFPTAAAFMLIASGPSAMVNKRILSNAIATRIGVISYPLYLWHWPLLAIAHIVEGAEPDPRTRAGLVVLALALAWLTYRYVERRVRSVARPARLSLGLTAAMLLIVLPLGLVANADLLPARNSSPLTLMYVAATKDHEYPKGLERTDRDPANLYRRHSALAATTVFVGDSHIEQYSPKVVAFIGDNPRTARSATFVADGGCPPIPTVYEDHHRDCADLLSTALKEIARPEVDTIVIGACWTCYFVANTAYRTPDGDNGDYDYYVLRDGQRHFFRRGDGAALAKTALRDFLLQLAATGKQVYLLLDNPYGSVLNPQTFLHGSRFSHITAQPVGPTVKIDGLQMQIRSELLQIAQQTGARILDPLPELCVQTLCRRLDGQGRPIFTDGNHLTAHYVRSNAAFIEKVLRVPTTPTLAAGS